MKTAYPIWFKRETHRAKANNSSSELNRDDEPTALASSPYTSSSQLLCSPLLESRVIVDSREAYQVVHHCNQSQQRIPTLKKNRHTFKHVVAMLARRLVWVFVRKHLEDGYFRRRKQFRLGSEDQLSRLGATTKRRPA